MATCDGSMFFPGYRSRNINNSLIPRNSPTQFPFCFSLSKVSSSSSLHLILVRAQPSSDKSNNAVSKNEEKVEEEVEVEEELPWIQEKALDLVEFSGSVTQAIPGPRVGQSSLPWVLAVPLAYLGITFVIAFVKTVRKFGSPREKRRQQVNKNAMVCKSIDELFEKGISEAYEPGLKALMQKTGFDMEEILRKYIRYALNEKPFNASLVSNLIQLRQKSTLDDSQVAGILNDISRRVVKEKGPVIMDMTGFTEKGFQRKLAVQALFGKVYYLSEIDMVVIHADGAVFVLTNSNFRKRGFYMLFTKLPDFCSRDGTLTVKEIFGVSDEDAEKLRLHTTSESSDLESLGKMVGISDQPASGDGSDQPDLSNESSSTSETEPNQTT